MGFPIIPASPPATPAQATVSVPESFLPVLCCICRARISYKANLAVEYVVCRRIDAERPDQREGKPATRQHCLFGRCLDQPSRTANVCIAFNIGCFEARTCIQLLLISQKFCSFSRSNTDYFVRSRGCAALVSQDCFPKKTTQLTETSGHRCRGTTRRKSALQLFSSIFPCLPQPERLLCLCHPITCIISKYLQPISSPPVSLQV